MRRVGLQMHVAGIHGIALGFIFSGGDCGGESSPVVFFRRKLCVRPQTRDVTAYDTRRTKGCSGRPDFPPPSKTQIVNCIPTTRYMKNVYSP
ncbi:hypothetical protein BCR44DRAFT_338613 [Catenaria anguillulae PL171]|uniref:Uncharacterized protein n=1 Tax=Catenaria anguillulae PL171 TaxID=765915 RepID=A0A1Y2I679_9FUNG|nr:hypothetical protein BCR44DRAFT_338613 [Catenaria anguillulae PL171]